MFSMRILSLLLGLEQLESLSNLLFEAISLAASLSTSESSLLASKSGLYGILTSTLSSLLILSKVKARCTASSPWPSPRSSTHFAVSVGLLLPPLDYDDIEDESDRSSLILIRTPSFIKSSSSFDTYRSSQSMSFSVIDSYFLVLHIS